MNFFCFSLCLIRAFRVVYAAPGDPETPTLLWPLDATTYSTEVILSSTKPASPVYCGLTFSEQHPDYPHQSIQLDGSSYIDIPVSYAITSGDDYSFSGMFKVTSNNGTFFHYRSDDNTQTFKELRLWFTDDIIHMSRLLSTGEESANVTQPLPVSWFYISMGIDISNGKMVVILDLNEIIKIENSFLDDVDIVLPGRLRIGATFDSTPPYFVGHVTCVGFYAGESKPDKLMSDDMCSDPSWSTNTPSCIASSIEKTTNTSGMFIKPEAIYSSILDLYSTISRNTEISCAMGCYHDKRCWFFKIQIENGGYSCLMYTSAVSHWNTPTAHDENIYQWQG